MTGPERWSAVDDYFAGALVPPDPALDAALTASDAAGLPPHHVAPNQGRLLELLARIAGARAILEIGTLGGYSAIWLARALPPGGRLVTLEANPAFAEVARRNVERAGVGDAVEIVVGQAVESLAALHAGGRGPFDFVFIDADKQSNPDYLRWSLSLARPGTVIVADNVVRDGHVLDPGSTDPCVVGIRRFVELVAATPRLRASAVQTLGSKGWDGFVLAVVGEG